MNKPLMQLMQQRLTIAEEKLKFNHGFTPKQLEDIGSQCLSASEYLEKIESLIDDALNPTVASQS